jgi:hypothetical protein
MGPARPLTMANFSVSKRGTGFPENRDTRTSSGACAMAAPPISKTAEIRKGAHFMCNGFQ